MAINPLVTVLMTVYNGGEYLKTSVRSILNQTFKDFEFLIVNDFSTDDSVDIIKLFNDGRIVIYNNEKNIGQTKSLNVGLNLAKGKYVARMDADDMAFPLWLDKSLDYIRKHPEYAAVGSAAIVMNESGRMKKALKTPTNFAEVIFHIFFGNAINHVGAIFNKEIILKNGGYNEEFKIAQDYELWSSLIRDAQRFINIPDVLVAVRVHESSLGYMEEKKKGLAEVAETIYRNITALTNLKISYEDAVKLRMFYRFPEQLSLEEFNYAHRLYEEIFYNLKDEFKINKNLLRRKLKRQMLIPYCKRAISEAEKNMLRSVRHTTSDYLGSHGFHPVPVLIFLMSFFGMSIIKRLTYIYTKWQEKAMRVIMSRS